jgi:hypothetical protein
MTTAVQPASRVEARTLDRLVETADVPGALWAHEVRLGDWVVIRTRNSTYALVATGDGRFRPSGGWFATSGHDTDDVGVSGCTWGGAAIHTRIVAAPGMCVEFDNGVRTTRVREVRVLRGDDGRRH